MSEALGSGVVFELPTPTGRPVSVAPIESPVMSDELSKKYPDIKTYRLFDPSPKGLASGVLTVSPSGINALIFSPEGNIIISPQNIAEDSYTIIYQSDEELSKSCEVGHEHGESFGVNKLRTKAHQDFVSGTVLRTYRLAILTTGEFFANNGSTQLSAQAALVSMVNSLRAVYEKEAAVSFTLVSTKNYENAATDPFNPSGGTNAFDAALAFGALISSEPANFALNKYDLGHVLHHSPGGGGVAYLYGPCRNDNLHATLPSPIKGGGWSGGTTTSLGTFIHEVGHQFSAGHTFNSSYGSCSGGNFTGGSAYEPGSGSTFMSYWGNCSPENISGDINRTYFHANSIESILWYATNYGTCSENSATGNAAPIINTNPSGASLIIPKGTPFRLQGSGSDPNGHPLLFNWEQYDLGSDRGGAKEAQNSTGSPIFRSVYPASDGNERTFPALSSILQGSPATTDEALPQVARNINMRLTARDGIATGGGTTSETLTLTVSNSGPFLLTSQNKPTLWLSGSGATAHITWSVNGTNSAPFNISNVKISFSTDGGQSFPHVLAASTPNDGSHQVSIPNIETTKGRIKIEPVGNWLFFDINNVDITVSTTCDAETITFLPSNSITEDESSPNLDLTLTPLGAQISSISGTLTTAEPTMYLVAQTSVDGCTYYSNQVPYHTYEFIAPTAGNYSFNYTPFPSVINIYSNSFNPGDPCGNLVFSSLTIGASATISTVFNVTLPAGKYIMEINTYAGPNPALPVNYTINSTGLPIYKPVPSPSSPYDYTYIVKKNSTGLIMAFTQNPDLTTYSGGAYTIHAMSYQGGLNLDPYVNTSFVTFQGLLTAGTVCGKLSLTSKEVTIVGDCPPTLALIGAGGAGVYNAQNTITSSQVLSGSGTIEYKAGKSIEMVAAAGSGFLVDANGGAVFKAEIGGCP